MKPRLFVASSVEQIHVAYAVQQNLDKDADITVWDQGVVEPSQTTIEGLLAQLDKTDFAVFICGPDDVVASRDGVSHVPRDNVIFECGLFVGRLGRERNVFIVPQSGAVRLPSNLLGVAAPTYDAGRTDVRAALGSACTDIRLMLQRISIRDIRRSELIQTQKDVYAYLFNRLNPYTDLSLTQDFLRLLPRQLRRVDDVLYPLDSLIHNYVPFLVEDSMRVYFAYRVSDPGDSGSAAAARPPYRIGISFSHQSDRWQEGLAVKIPSNIHRTYSRKNTSRVRDARGQLNSLTVENQRVDDEGSVIGVPVVYGDDDGNTECIGVIGISTPDPDAAVRPQVEALAQELGVLFSSLFYAYGRYLQRREAFDAVVRDLRLQISEHFETKFDPVSA